MKPDVIALVRSVTTRAAGPVHRLGCSGRVFMSLVRLPHSLGYLLNKIVEQR